MDKALTTEDMVELFIEKGVWAYKKLNRNTIEGRKLMRHEPVEMEGQTFTCYREYSCFKMGIFLQENLPEADVKVTLDGNDSVIEITVSAAEQQAINGKMFSYLKEWKFV